MTFDLATISILLIAAAIYATAIPGRWRGWALFAGSIIALYWLQPNIRVRWLDFILPTLTLMLTIATWILTRAEDQSITQEDRIAFGIAIVLILGLSLFRFVPASVRYLVASRPPNPTRVIGLLTAAFVLIALIGHLPRSHALLLLLLIAIFVVLKTNPLATAVSRLLRTSSGQDASLASPLDLNWLGFSYVAFRLIHTVRDRQSGLLPALSLREYMTYVTFFPAFIAGPIDRAERFIEDFRALPEKIGLDAARISAGMTRIAIGLGKKFVIADSLAQGMALSATNAAQVNNAIGMWLLLYGYGLRLYFDFSGYSDIAIGIGILFGVRLPENFANPYMRTNISQFWQSWHITLSNWARFYVFSPLSRTLLRRKPKPPTILIVLVTQLTTMLVIGLWHGVTVNFVIWGVWHGVGLWLHKQWSDRTRRWYRGLNDKPTQKRAWAACAWFITFHFVILGWVWFALPDVGQSMAVFRRLLGMG